MIRLTLASGGQYVYVNPAHIQSLEPETSEQPHVTHVYTAKSTWVVTETPETILGLLDLFRVKAPPTTTPPLDVRPTCRWCDAELYYRDAKGGLCQSCAASCEPTRGAAW